MRELRVTNLDVKFLRQLLEAVESGELVLTDFTVSSGVEEVTADAQGTHVTLTGEKNWYITTRPAPTPVEAPSEPPALVKWQPSLQVLTARVDTLIANYQRGFLTYSQFFQAGAALGLMVTKASADHPLGTQIYIDHIRLAARLGRAMNHG